MRSRSIETWLSLIGAVAFAAAVAVSIHSAHAGIPSIITIDNDAVPGTLGYFSVEVRDAGESRDAVIVADGAVSGIIEGDIVFDYSTYVSTDFDAPALQLSEFATSEATLTGDDEVTSSGSFTGSAGNVISWVAVTSIADGSDTMITSYTFTAETGTLGTLRLLQYLDEDVFGISDDFLFTRGSAAAGNLELFTIDVEDVVGISQSGAFGASQGLTNASFDGWAADEWSDLRDLIEAGPVPVSPTGVVDEISLVPEVHPVVGAGWGPEDITTVMVWTVDPDADTAVITTTLGGVPIGDFDDDGIPDVDDLCPEYPSTNVDTDGNGIGDECECGDQNGDGTVDVNDILAINAAIFDPTQVTELCDTNDDQLCDVQDILGANAKIFGAEAYCSRYPAP
jgi:hypothetical protein